MKYRMALKLWVTQILGRDSLKPICINYNDLSQRGDLFTIQMRLDSISNKSSVKFNPVYRSVCRSNYLFRSIRLQQVYSLNMTSYIIFSLHIFAQHFIGKLNCSFCSFQYNNEHLFSDSDI